MATTQVESSLLASNRKLILAGQIAFLPTGVLTTLLGPMLPILAIHWNLNDTQAGNLFLVQFLAMVVGVQLSGVLLARFGYRPAFLSGLLAMAVGVATVYAGSLWLGLISIAVYGLGLGLMIPTDNLLIAEIASVSPGRSSADAVSLLNFFWGVGAVFCSLMVAWTAAQGLLPYFFGAVAIFLILLAVVTRTMSFPAAARRDQPSASWLELAKHPAVWLFAAVFLLYPGAETAVGGWTGSYVSRMGAQGAALASVMPAFFWSALTVGRALGTAFLRHVSERQVLRAGCGAGAAGIGLMLWSPSLTGVIAGAMITGLSYSTIYPITVARLSQRYGVAARSIGAVMFSLASVGPAVIPWMVGVISHSTGSLRAGLLVPLGATLILLLIHLLEW